MDLKSITEKLNSEFRGSERKLVFWYDDNAEFVDEVDSINLENASIYKLTPDNWFYTKYFFELVDKTTNYLVYTPFSKPADRDNHLADTAYYSKLFYADKISLVMLDLKIPEKFKERLKAYPRFFYSSERERTEKRVNERINKLYELGIESWSEEIIDIGILSVLCGVKTPNFDEILRALIVSVVSTEGILFDNNKYISIFEKMGILNIFWQLCQKYYGYNDENPALEKLIITLLITYTAHDFNGELPKAWSAFLSTKKNDITVFISNFMNNMLYKDHYIGLSEKISIKIKVKEYMSKAEVENFMDCDTFPAFDEMILSKLVEWISNECVNQQGLVSKISDALEIRLKKHFALNNMNIGNEYRTIEAALMLIQALEMPKAGDNTVEKYINGGLHLVDRYYRKFYYYFDKIESNSSYLEMRKLIENIYTNAFLCKLSIAWGDKLENYKSISEIPHTKQYNFYRLHVAPAVKKEATVVIISDALRYECAIELNNIFNDSVKFHSEVDYMISCVPSCTKLGMAVLLPHKQISITENYDVLVDGQATVSTEQRQKILESYNPASVACKYSDIISLGRDDVRKLLTGKELIYIYHNQIDARGDNSSTENEVFEACEETFEEIIKLVKKLTVDKSITNYIITADHGFIYKRDKLDESDKVNLPKYKNSFQNKRFIMYKSGIGADGSGEGASDRAAEGGIRVGGIGTAVCGGIAADGTLSFPLGYLGSENEGMRVTVPRGADIFKVSGGGQNYVHGGASLQELIVPVIKLKTVRYKKETGYVEVVLVSLSRKITNLITYLDFMQNENVTDTLLPVVMKIYFINESDEKISNENIIYADRKNDPPEKRMFKEKFTFRNRKYSKSDRYYLVMIDDKTDVELGRYEFVVDIAFSDDFGFKV
ncbi:MAG: BREX-1 system phosphatase PglZ type A [Ignavibacteria bacterium]|nr:BREX-1 system phosphatase PglZ type A [Ignavibacteria bacterium]